MWEKFKESKFAQKFKEGWSRGGAVIVVFCLVYVILSAIVKAAGTGWINKLMPTVVIGPTVALIGLSLAGNAVGDLTKSSATGEAYSLAAIACGLFTFAVTILVCAKGKGFIKLIPFIIGILAGYAVATIFTLIGNATANDALKVIDFSVFSGMSLFEIPQFTFLTAIDGVKEIDASYIGTIAMAYLPVALVVFAEHIADHKNFGFIIDNSQTSKRLLNNFVLFADGSVGACP